MITINPVPIIAAAVHEANRQLRIQIGDPPIVGWGSLNKEYQTSLCAGVQAIIENVNLTPAESHEKWVEFKLAHGWTLGEVIDDKAKTHPCLVTWDALNPEQKLKDVIFVETVRSMLASLAKYTTGNLN